MARRQDLAGQGPESLEEDVEQRLLSSHYFFKCHVVVPG